MKRLNRMMALLFVVCLVVSMSACASSAAGPTAASANPTQTKAQAEATATTAATESTQTEPVKKELYKCTTSVSPFGGFSSDTVVGKVILEKFNFEMEVVVGTGTTQDQLSLMLAGGDYPDIIWLTGNNWVMKYINAGALVCLDDYLKDCPNFKKLYANHIPYWRLAAQDGKLYKWEFDQPVDYEVSFAVNDFLVRTDALEKQNWPNISKTSDWIKFFKQALQDIPETNGQPTVGLTCPFGGGWNLEADLCLNGPVYSNSIAGSVWWNQVEQRFEDFLASPDTKLSYKFFNEAYREGILDPESFTDTDAETGAKLNAGQCLGVYYLTWVKDSVNTALVQAGKENLQYVHLPAVLDEQATGKRQIMAASTNNWQSAAITKTAKDPARIMEVMDYFCTEEGQILNQSGVEGIHYTIVDGKRVPTQEYLAKSNSDADYNQKQGITFFACLGYPQTLASDGQPYNLKSSVEVYDRYFATARHKEAFQKLGWTSSHQWWMENGVAAPSGFSNVITLDTSSELGKLEEKMIEFKLKYGLKTIMAASEAEFEAAWAQMLEDYKKLNPEKVVDEYNRLLGVETQHLEQIKEKYKDIDN